MNNTVTATTSWFTTWLSQAPLTKLIDILLLGGLFVFIMFCIYQFIKALKLKPLSITSKGTTIKFSEDRTAKKSEEGLSLLNHKVFRLLTNAETMQFYHKEDAFTNKDLINIAFLHKCVFRSFDEELTQFVKDIEKRQGSNISDFPEVLNRIIKKYETEAESVEIELINGQRIRGVPSVYITKFNNWNNEHMNMCKQGINETLVDTYYLTWDYRASTCLEYLYMIINMIIHDAELTLEHMNGDLTKCIDDMVHDLNC